MKMKKKFLTIFLLFFIAVAFASSCSPIGSLLVDSNAAQDYIKVSPKRYVYIKNETFIPEDELLVSGIFRGKEQDIKINDKNLVIKILEPSFSEPDPVIVDKEKGFKLETEVTYTVIINYLDLKTDYPIEVVPPSKMPPDMNGSHGIEFIWN